MMDSNTNLLQMFINYLIKKLLVEYEIMLNNKLAEELHKSIITKFEKR